MHALPHAHLCTNMHHPCACTPLSLESCADRASSLAPLWNDMGALVACAPWQ
jgi:hypothetical protein